MKNISYLPLLIKSILTVLQIIFNKKPKLEKNKQLLKTLE